MYQFVSLVFKDCLLLTNLFDFFRLMNELNGPHYEITIAEYVCSWNCLRLIYTSRNVFELKGIF